MIQKIEKLDQEITTYLSQHRLSEKKNKLLRIYTRLGDGYIWGAFALYLIYSLGWTSFLGILWEALAALVVSLALYWFIKLNVKRQRPFNFNRSIQAEVPPLDKYSFPSGHTMNNLAVGIAVFYNVPHLGWLMLLLPITWGLLRIYFNVHWFSDIIAGIFLGLLSFIGGHLLWQMILQF